MFCFNSIDPGLCSFWPPRPVVHFPPWVAVGPVDSYAPPVSQPGGCVILTNMTWVVGRPPSFPPQVTPHGLAAPFSVASSSYHTVDFFGPRGSGQWPLPHALLGTLLSNIIVCSASKAGSEECASLAFYFPLRLFACLINS